ncbi:MAG: hypothetical protein JW784_01630 [Candidatus Cloacimonetes bacterium]|nr:hypothetical protein [Candidatus Cloacimonadota bacterium]
MNMKTLVLEEMPDLFWQEIKKRDIGKFFFRELTSSLIPEILIIRTKSKITSEILAGYPNLKLIIRAGSGYDNVDIQTARELGIRVCSTPLANGSAAFEHTVALIFSLIKHLNTANNAVRNGIWKTGLPESLEIRDLRILIIGVGLIGTLIGRYFTAWGAQVRGVDPYLGEKDWKRKGIQNIDIKSGLAWCNTVTFHCPLTHETSGLFSQELLGFVPKPIWLINTARGGLLCDGALIEGLKSGIIRGMAIDVYEDEPPGNKIWFDPTRVILTPHSASHTDAAKHRLVKETIEVWEKFRTDGEVLHEVDYRFFNKFE